MTLHAVAAKKSVAAWPSAFRLVATELAEVEALVRVELRAADPAVDRLVRSAAELGGKRLRPALLLLAAKAAGTVEREHVLLAGVVEMVHTATLVHDDVLDEALLRRHRETINARAGNEASVLVGDFLFTHAFALASSLESTFACRAIGRATNVVRDGELRQVAARGDFGLSEARYLSIIDAKTAELCACACRLGAHYAGASAAVEEALANYGRALGMAFQIADDLLDILGRETLAGKSLGSDARLQKPTLPVLRLLAQVSPGERTELVAQLQGATSDARAILADWWPHSDALEYADRRAREFASQAGAALDGVAPSAAHDVLAALTRLVVDRCR